MNTSKQTTQEQKDFINHLYNQFASTHVRNVATVIGNIANSSPVSDNIPVFMALHAILSIIDTKTMSER